MTFEDSDSNSDSWKTKYLFYPPLLLHTHGERTAVDQHRYSSVVLASSRTSRSKPCRPCHRPKLRVQAPSGSFSGFDKPQGGARHAQEDRLFHLELSVAAVWIFLFVRAFPARHGPGAGSPVSRALGTERSHANGAKLVKLGTRCIIIHFQPRKPHCMYML